MLQRVCRHQAIRQLPGEDGEMKPELLPKQIPRMDADEDFDFFYGLFVWPSSREGQNMQDQNKRGYLLLLTFCNSNNTWEASLSRATTNSGFIPPKIFCPCSYSLPLLLIAALRSSGLISVDSFSPFYLLLDILIRI